MLKGLNKFFIETLKISSEIWLYILLAVIAVAFLVTLIAGLAGGEFNKVKSLMATVAKNPGVAVASMKQMPIAIKNRYRQARVAGVKPSDLVTEHDCVTVPYGRSLVSKVWIVTFVTTVLCAAIGFFVASLLTENIAAEEITAELNMAPYLVPVMLLIAGGIFTLIGAIVGKCALGGAVKTYAKFAQAIDGGDAGRTVQAGGQGYAAGGQDHEAQEPVMQAYSEPQAAQPVYEQPVQQEYAEPAQPVYEQPAQPVYEQPVQNSAADFAAQQEEARRREREEKIAMARAAQAQAQAQAQTQARPASAPVHTSADDVIARIEQIDRDGAPRETMREVAQLLQKERAKPENKTPEQQKKLNEALSKLLKAMSAASKK